MLTLNIHVSLKYDLEFLKNREYYKIDPLGLTKEGGIIFY